MKTIPTNHREAAAAAYLSGKGTLRAIAAQFGLTVSQLEPAVRVARQKAGVKSPGRPQRKIGKTEERVLIAFLGSHSQATLKEMRSHLAEVTGVLVSTSTLNQALQRLEIRRERPPRQEPARNDEQAPRRYGYGPRHRRDNPSLLYPSSLTDEEWELVRDLFENTGAGRPPLHARRLMLDACCYVLRTGCPWRLLAHDFPPWQAVYRMFRRWAANGAFEAMNDRLRARYRIHFGKQANPTAAVIDSQSIKTAEKGGPWVTTPTRGSRVTSVTL